MSFLDLNPEYSVIITDSSFVHPFAVPGDLVDVAMRIRNASCTQFTFAQDLFYFLDEKLSYNKSDVLGYRSAREVWAEREGICGEMTFLYNTLARIGGLQTSYVSVQIDYAKKDVYHACCGVFLPKLVLVDLAYHRFDVKHEEFTLRSDNWMYDIFHTWRRK